MNDRANDSRGSRPTTGARASSTGARVSRFERALKIARLRDAEGLSFSEIATHVGLGAQTVRDYYRDPEGKAQRARRERYRGTCASCGGPTSGYRGPELAPKYCRRCVHEQRRTWTPDGIVAAIRDWHKVTGAPPTVADWSSVNSWAVARPKHCGGGSQRWPSESTVRRRFGPFRAAIAAAGFEVPTGGAPTRWPPERILSALRTHRERSGAIPRPTDWVRSGDDHPAQSTVYRVLGSWQRALSLAGIARAGPRATGRRRARR